MKRQKTSVGNEEKIKKIGFRFASVFEIRI